MIDYGRSPFSPVVNVGLDNLRLGGALRWKAEDCQLGRLGSVLWQAPLPYPVSRDLT
jgi:hypothetical protein